jgi:hypothetical protein
MSPKNLLHILFAAALVHAIPASLAAPSVERIEKSEGGWRLLRNSEPYFIKGAVVGPRGSLDTLQQAGANSIRTHSGMLDEAQRRSLTALVGLPLGNPLQGFDYADTNKVGQQFNRARDLVRKFRDHPALLFWNLGNEPEIHTTPEQRVPVWREANRLRAGEVAGYSDIHQLYKDGIHLNETGSHLVGCAFFATLFREDPAGLPTEPYGKIGQSHPRNGVEGRTRASGVGSETSLTVLTPQPLPQ